MSVLPHAKWKKAELVAEVDRLETHVQELINEIHKLKNEKAVPQHNERKAGRKKKLDAETVATIKQCRADGMTYTETAKQLGLSVGLVHKADKQ